MVSAVSKHACNNTWYGIGDNGCAFCYNWFRVLEKVALTNWVATMHGILVVLVKLNLLVMQLSDGLFGVGIQMVADDIEPNQMEVTGMLLSLL